MPLRAHYDPAPPPMGPPPAAAAVSPVGLWSGTDCSRSAVRTPQQPLQNRLLLEVFQDHPPERRPVARRFAGVMPGGRFRRPRAGPAAARCTCRRAPRRPRSGSVRPPPPPGETDHPLRQHRFQRPVRLQVVEHLLAVLGEFHRIFPLENRRPPQQAVPDGILRRGGFTLRACADRWTSGHWHDWQTLGRHWSW